MSRLLSAVWSTVRQPVNALRVIWVLTILWNELGVFLYADCEWPGVSQDHPSRILIVADPQILDHRSYRERSWYLTALSQFIVDLNIRKSWRVARRTKPHAVVVLGDMMDSGRFAMNDSEYEIYYNRFRSIFHIDPSIPTYYLPGNHDIGIGTSAYFSDKARSRFTTHFGPLNQQINLQNHVLVLIDAPALVEEDAQRIASSVGHPYNYDQWMAIPGGPVEFIKSFGRDKPIEPVILFTHIPLWRPDSATCGPLREKGSIKAGTGFGYQNTIGKEATEFILESTKPLIVFSGDDHDYCEYMHKIGGTTEVKEISVKSLSMAMGIRRPGFELLSLFPSPSHNGTQTFLEGPCHLPDQLGIYLSLYVPLILLSLLVLVILNVLYLRGADAFSQPKTRLRRHSDEWTLASPINLRFTRSRKDVEAGGKARSRSPSDDDEPPGPMSTFSSSFRSDGKTRWKNVVAGFGKDVLKVGIFPLSLWMIITWWTFSAE